jgi:hypothetical protein
MGYSLSDKLLVKGSKWEGYSLDSLPAVKDAVEGVVGVEKCGKVPLDLYEVLN